MKILHIADLHIQSGGYQQDIEDALVRVANIANAYEVDLLLIAGDVFDSVSTPTQRLAFMRFLDSIRGAYILTIRGNHDQKDDLKIFNGVTASVSIVSEEPYSTVLPINYKPLEDEIQIITLPHFNPSLIARERLGLSEINKTGTNLLDDLLDYYLQKIYSHIGPSILVAHTDVDGAEWREGYVPKDNGLHLNRAKLEALGCPVMLGHIHKHQALSDLIVYSGSVTRLNFGEANDDKGCVLWSYENHKWSWEFISLDPRPMYDFKMAWIDGEFNKLRLIKPVVDEFSGARIKFTYEVDECDINKVDLTEIKELFSLAYELKIEQKPILSTATRNSEIVTARTIPDKLALWAEAKGLPPEKTGELQECHQELISDILAEKPTQIISKNISPKQGKLFQVDQHDLLHPVLAAF